MNVYPAFDAEVMEIWGRQDSSALGIILITATTHLALTAKNTWSCQQQKRGGHQEQYSEPSKYPNNLKKKIKIKVTSCFITL